MKKTWVLTKILFKNNGWFSERIRNSDISLANTVIMLLLMFCSIGCLIGIIAHGIYDNLAIVGYQHILIPVLLFIICTITLIFSFTSIISMFYFSRNTDILLPLPLKPHNVLIQNF